MHALQRVASLRVFAIVTALIAVVALMTSNVVGESVMLVVNLDDPLMEPGNESVEDRLLTLGHTVQLVDDDESNFVDPTGMDLIVISSSVASGSVGTYFTTEPIPLINWESALWDELEMSNSGPNIQNQIGINVVNTDHPLAQEMGLTELGEVETRDWEIVFHGGRYANLAPDATVIAEQIDDGTVPLIAVLEEGGELNSGFPAEAMRICLFLGDEALDGANEVGVAIFDGAVNYALGITGGGPAELQAGDANMDYEFNQLDLVQVQVAAKYLTGEAATWGEGDWDAAPGGAAGSPPQGNGLFDQLDIIAALAAGTYLNGPYAAIQQVGAANDPTVVGSPAGGGNLDGVALSYVPEPSALSLLLLGLCGTLATRRRRQRQLS